MATITGDSRILLISPTAPHRPAPTFRPLPKSLINLSHLSHLYCQNLWLVAGCRGYAEYRITCFSNLEIYTTRDIIYFSTLTSVRIITKVYPFQSDSYKAVLPRSVAANFNDWHKYLALHLPLFASIATFDSTGRHTRNILEVSSITRRPQLKIWPPMLPCELALWDFKKRCLFFLTARINAGLCTSQYNIRQLVGHLLPSSITVLISYGSIALVWLCPHMDPRGTILLDETIHSLDTAVYPVSVRFGGQYIIHLSNSGQAPNIEGAF